MKELMTVIQAITRARDALNSYFEAGKCLPKETLQELSDITCALEKMQANIGSPPIAPDGHTFLTKAPTAGSYSRSGRDLRCFRAS